MESSNLEIQKPSQNAMCMRYGHIMDNVDIDVIREAYLISDFDGGIFEFIGKLAMFGAGHIIDDAKMIDNMFDDMLRPLNMNPEIRKDAAEKTEHMDYNSMYPDFEKSDKSEKDCMREEDRC